MKNICVFCGARAGTNPVYESTAKLFGHLLASYGKALVYGGGNVGMMGTIADAVLAKGGNVFGVIPKSLKELEVAHEGITELVVVNSMHERKKYMYDISDAFIALPGGFGTLDEFCEILTWSQLGYHDKPIAFLNVNGYFNALLKHFQHSVNEGFVNQQLNNKIKIYQTLDDLEGSEFLAGSKF